jgi:hypothetical protein
MKHSTASDTNRHRRSFAPLEPVFFDKKFPVKSDSDTTANRRKPIFYAPTVLTPLEDTNIFNFPYI